MIEKKLLRLEQMSHAEKIAYWGQERPWETDGTALRLPFKGRPFPPSRVQVDEHGNITRMPFLVNRPCFGQASAYMRHGGNQHAFNPRTGGYFPDRCARCPVTKACAFVCEKRLNCTPEVRALYEEWKHRGGRGSTWTKVGSAGSASVTIVHLLAALRAQNFTSDNDPKVQAHYEELIEKRRQGERERKRRERNRRSVEQARQGQIRDDVGRVLEAHRIWREQRFEIARRLPNAPLCLQKVLDDAPSFDSFVWLAWNRIKLRGAHPNPSSCTTELQQMGRFQQHAHNALRDRVRRSVNRMSILEAMPMADSRDGERVWPSFTTRDLRKWLEIDSLRPSPPQPGGVAPRNTLQDAA